MAIAESPHGRATVSEIIAYITSRFPYFKRSDKKWQKSIECKLTFDKNFLKVPLQGGNSTGKCFNYWMLGPEYRKMFKKGKLRRLRHSKRPFRSALGVPSGTPTHRHHEGHDRQQQCHGSESAQTQRPGDFNRHSTASPTSPSLSASEFGSTDRAATDSSHPGDGRCTDASPSGDTGNSCVSSTSNDTVGTTSGRAADRDSGTTGSADSAKMKPPFSYEELIAMAILDKLHRRATMSEIVTYVANRFPYFERSNVSWQKSIRCKLAFSKYFVKVPLQGGNLMSRCFNYWMIDPKYERLFKNGKFHRRKVVKRLLRRAHRHLRQHPADVPVRPQLPGDVDKHSTLTRTSTSLSLSGVGNTARAVPDSSHTGGSRREDDTPASDVTVPTSNADTDGGGASHSFAANGEGEERGLGDAVSASTSNTRPPYSFKALITMAIAQSPHRRATLSEILAYIRSRFPYFKWKNKSWQHTVSCTLSSSKCFVKVPREGSNHKGKYFNYWKLDPQYMDTIKNGNFRRKRSVKQSFRKPLRVVPPRIASYGAAYHPHDAHDFHQWEHDDRASLPVRPQLLGDIDKHSSTVTPTLTSMTVTKVDSTGQSAPNLTEPGVDLCKDDTLASDVTVSVDDDATPISASGGTADDVDSGTVTESGGTTASSAADGVRVACNADTRPPFNYTELSAMAIAQSPQRKATRSEISAYIMSRFPYFKHYKGWQKGLVNNLSRNKYFINVPQNAGKQKGTIWTLDPRYKGVIENGDVRRQQTLKQALQRTLQAAAPAKLPSGACSTRQQCDGPDRRQQHGASPPAQTQPLCDVDRHRSSTVTPTLTSVTVTEVDSTDQSAPNSTEPGVDLCENSSLASDVTVYVDDDATPTSASGGTADDVDSGTATKSGGTTASSAANGVCEEQHPDDAGTSCNADTRPPFNYTELCAMAIAQSPHRKATRSEISAYIVSRFPYFKHCKGWQKGLSNNLSRTKFFINVPQNAGKQKGTIWTLDPRYKDVIENGNLGQQQFAKQPLRKILAKLPSGADATRQRRDGHDRQQQHDASLSAPSQLLCDANKHSSADPTSPGLSVSEFDGTVRAAPDSSRPGESRREGDSLAADATASTGGAVTSTSTSGGTGNCHIGDTDNEGGGTDAESAADEADGEQTSCNTGPAGTARAKRRFCYEELIAAAIIDSPQGKATVTEICSYIRRHFPYFRQCKNNWQKTLYGKLSIGKYFIKMPAEGANHNGRRFNYWMLDPQYEDMFKNGKFHRHKTVKRPFRRALGEVTTSEVSRGTGTACHPHDAHHRQQPPGDIDERSTLTRTSTSLSVSAVGSTARAASDSSHTGSSRCEDDTLTPNVTVMTNGAGSTTSASGGTDDVVNGIADSDGGGAGRSVAANEEGEERGLTDSTTTASTRPPYSFKALIAMAIAQSPHRRATRSEIYAYIGSRFPYFKWNKKSWQHTISCTLSSSKCFVKVPPEGGNHKGRHFNYWKLDPQYSDTLKNGNVRRQWPVKQSFRRSLRVVPPRKASFGAAYHPHDAHDFHQWQHDDRASLPVRPQLPGDIDKHSSLEGDHGNDSSGNVLLREMPNAQKGDFEQCTAERKVAVENDDGTVRPAPGCEEESTRQPVPGQPVPEEDGHVNSGQSSVSCSVCHRVFTRKYRLKEHFSVHTGEHPYSCNVCSRTFRLKKQLKRHSWLHGGECPYVCNVCHKKFLTPGDLKRHLWLHTSESPYMCGVCQKKFTTGSDLKRHSLLHSGVRPYSCGVCHKKFTSNGELKRHLLLHAGNCHYRCGFCRKPFLSGTSLRRHLRVHRAPVTGAVRDTTEVHLESQIRDESTD